MSKTLYPDIQKYVPEERVWYCANGIAETGAGGREQGAGGKEKRSVEILFLSNLIESKGVFVLLEACRLLKKRKISFHCTFVGGIGDVVENQFLDKVAQMDLIEHVVYDGKKYGVEKNEALLNSEIFVHPTYNDCFPLVLLEAMQHSLPIVSTFEGAIPEIVEDSINGFLVPQKDAKSLAEKLEILIRNPQLRQQMGRASRRKYENEFTLEKFENRLNDILNSL